MSPVPALRWPADVIKGAGMLLAERFGVADLASAAFEILGDLVILRGTKQQIGEMFAS